jgi:hypothetical protein
MKKTFVHTILLLCIYTNNSYSQQQGCIDSISLNRFISPFFGGVVNSPVRDTANNIYINGFTSFGGDSYTLTKFNTNNEPVWIKIFRRTPFTQISPAGLKTVDNKANLIFGGGGSAMKFDSAANFLFSKKQTTLQKPT